MLEAVFSFRGRLNRLQYFLGNVGLFVGVIVLVIVGAVTVGAQLRASGGAPSLATLGPIALLALILVPPLFWISFSLQARRFRDIGWDPVLMVPGWIGVLVIDELVAKGVPALSLSHGQHTLFGVLFNLAMAGCLLFWPGKGEDPAPPLLQRPPSTWTPPPPEPAPAPRPVMPAPSYGAAPAAPRFGRRGLPG
ncbi:MAG TPA: DUF805 domain-containing protein [Caulobacteraceae bacterium]|jgi:uncharacterized membrane protein YhaH (DUF805 family)|nr:DUF805 domain-containing protein [Caulobacteraceae bacterium]